LESKHLHLQYIETMTAGNPLFKELKELVARKDDIEKEIRTISLQLDSGGFGLKAPLVDSEGFPINDVDKILATREGRNRLAHLQTDHKALMKEIEEKMVIVHSQSKTAASVPSPMQISKTIEDIPFAQVDEVTAGSPAALAGLEVNDLVTVFGSVKHTGGLKAVGELVRDSEGRNITVEVKRIKNGTEITKTRSLVPKKMGRKRTSWVSFGSLFPSMSS